MIHNIPKPALTPNFTIKDIHTLREWNYECMKNATLAERRAESKRATIEFYERMNKLEIRN